VHHRVLEGSLEFPVYWTGVRQHRLRTILYQRLTMIVFEARQQTRRSAKHRAFFLLLRHKYFIAVEGPVLDLALASYVRGKHPPWHYALIRIIITLL